MMKRDYECFEILLSCTFSPDASQFIFNLGELEHSYGALESLCIGCYYTISATLECRSGQVEMHVENH